MRCGVSKNCGTQKHEQAEVFTICSLCVAMGRNKMDPAQQPLLHTQTSHTAHLSTFCSNTTTPTCCCLQSVAVLFELLLRIISHHAFCARDTQKPRSSGCTHWHADGKPTHIHHCTALYQPISFATHTAQRTAQVAAEAPPPHLLSSPVCSSTVRTAPHNPVVLTGTATSTGYPDHHRNKIHSHPAQHTIVEHHGSIAHIQTTYSTAECAVVAPPAVVSRVQQYCS